MKCRVTGQRNRAAAQSQRAGRRRRRRRPAAHTNNDTSPDQAGNLAAMAAAVAGFQLIPGLDGATDMYSRARTLGRSEQRHVRRTRFGHQRAASGRARDDVDQPLPVRRLEGWIQRRADLDPDDPGLQLLAATRSRTRTSRRRSSGPTQTAAAQGQKYTNMRVGGNAAGPIAMIRFLQHRVQCRAAIQATLRILLNATPFGLVGGRRRAGFRRATRPHSRRPADIPTSARRHSNAQAQDAAQALGQSRHHAERVRDGPLVHGRRGGQLSAHAAGRAAAVYCCRRRGTRTKPRSGARTRSLVHTNYFWFGVFSKTTLGIAGAGNASSSVRVSCRRAPYASLHASRRRCVGAVAASSAAAQSSRRSAIRTVQLNNQLSWYSLDNTHTHRV